MKFQNFIRFFEFFTGTAAIVLCLSGCATPLQWSPYAAALDSMSIRAWKADLDFLNAEIAGKRRHPDPFHISGSERKFSRAYNALRNDLESNPGRDARVTTDLMVTGISRMLAFLGEGHTALNSYPETVFPLGVRWFAASPGADISGGLSSGYSEDPVSGAKLELRIVRVPDSLKTLLGGRIIRIADKTLDEALPLVRSVISADHPGTYQVSEPQVFTDPRLMRGLGLADVSGLRFTVELENDVRTQMLKEAARGTFTLVSPAIPAENLPLSRTAGAPSMRFAKAAPGVLYVRYDSCDDEGSAFFQNVLNELESGSYERLILDLRNNSGGTSVPGSWFASRVKAWTPLRRPGAVRVLMGPVTFSSAMMLAAELMDGIPSLFIGQAIAEPVDSWGEVGRFRLPESGLVVGHSTKFFGFSRGKSLRLTPDGLIAPDPGYTRIPTWDEWVSGKDPVFDLAVSGGTQ